MSQAINFRRRDSNASPAHTNGSSTGGGSSLTNNNSLKNNDLGLSPRWRASPMSFKMGSLIGSLGTRLYPAPGCSPTPALDTQDFKMGSMSTSYESRLLQALSTSHQTINPDDGCSNYTCCGLPLTDLHALLDHFEESHVYVLDHQAMASPQQLDPLQSTAAGVAIPVPTGPSGAGYEDMQMNNMEMDEADMDAANTESPLLGSGGSSSATSSQNSSPHMGSQAALTAASTANGSIYPYYADLRNLMANAAATGVPTASSTTAGSNATGIIMETAPVPAPPSNLSVQLAQMQQNQCIPPSLLFSPAGSPGSSRPQSVAGATTATNGAEAESAAKTDAKAADAASKKAAAAAAAASKPRDDDEEEDDEDLEIFEASEEVKAEVAALLADVKLDPDVRVVSGPGIVHPGPPPPTQATTSFSKPFKCPTPNCNKSYKQANGLKYHMTHGQCCFLPKDPALEGLDEVEKDKVERPFGCGVGGCERRYKNMNGLRYHYQHSGAHGAVGLALLAAGTHSVQIAAHNAAIGRSAAKLAAQQRAGSVVSNVSSSASSTMPQSPGGAPKSPGVATASRASSVATVKGATVPGASTTATHSRTPSGSSTPGAAVSGVRRLSNATSPVRSNTAPGGVPARPGQAPTATTYAQSTYYTSQPGYPYISQPGAGYPYLPTSTTTAAQYANRGPVFPPTSTGANMTSAIAAMAGAFGSTSATTGLGAPFTYNAAAAAAAANTNANTTATQPQRPHQLMRTNSHGAGAAPVVATSAVTAVVSSGSSPRASAVMDVDEEGDSKMDG